MRTDAIDPGRWVQTTTAAFEVTLTTPSSSSTMVETVTTTHDPLTGTQRTLRGGQIDPNFLPLPNPAEEVSVLEEFALSTVTYVYNDRAQLNKL